MLIARSATRGFVNIGDPKVPTFFQSEHERNFAILCKHGQPGCRLTWEPFSIAYFDIERGKQRKYTPDYLVEFPTDEGTTRLLVEVKTMRDYRRDRHQLSVPYLAAEKWASSQPRTRFKVATDVWMKEMGLPNFLALEAAENRKFDACDLDGMLQLILNHNRLSLSETLRLCRDMSKKPKAAVPVLLRLVSERKLAFDIRRPLDKDSIFYAGQIDNLFG